MQLITSNEILTKHIPNVLASVKGEISLFDKLSSALEMSEQWVVKEFLGQQLFDRISSADSSDIFRIYTSRIVVSDAFLSSIPSLDLVLTPNGFGIVSNSNVAPASRERVDNLMKAVELERDKAIHLLLNALPSSPEWLDSEHGTRFASSMFPSLDIVDMLGIAFPRWRKFVEIQILLTNIENSIIRLFIGQEQMTIFRQENISPSSSSLLMKTVIRSLRAYEVQLLKAKLSASDSTESRPPSALLDIVNVIRLHPNEFPAWHNSKIADLFQPAIFVNKKNDNAYWF